MYFDQLPIVSSPLGHNTFQKFSVHVAFYLLLCPRFEEGT